MAIQYPLSPPATPGFRRVQFAARSVAGITASPYTGQQQVYSWPGEWWEASFELPPMVRADAEAWIACLASLRGVYGTLLLGDPAGRTPRGSAAGAPASVDGASQLGSSLATLGWTASQSGILLPGDYIQIAQNYEPYPRAIDNAHWGKSQCTITATNIAAPNGVAEGERATPDGGATNATIIANLTSYPVRFVGLPWTFSVWLKAASGTPTISIFVIENPGSLFTETICNLTTSWQRFSVTKTLTAAATAFYIQMGGGNSWVVAEGAIDIWGVGCYCPTLDARLHKGLTTAPSDANTKSTLDVFPRLRESPPDFSAIITASPVGAFRLAENRVVWDIDEAKSYGIGFKVVEAF
jgi:hypothetical protein